MPVVRPQQIEMIPVSKITVLNPRSRNKRQHREIVNNIESIGLKRPITVSRHPGPGGPSGLAAAAFPAPRKAPGHRRSCRCNRTSSAC